MEFDYDDMTKVTMNDLEVASKFGYQNSTIWLALNLVSLLSDKSRDYQNRKFFQNKIGHSMYKSKNYDDWSTGSFEDLLELTTTLLDKQDNRHSVIWRVNSISYRDHAEISIRIRRFANCKSTLFGPSAYLNRDSDNCYYMWDYNSKGQLVQIPEQALKERLILWDNRDILYKEVR